MIPRNLGESDPPARERRVVPIGLDVDATPRRAVSSWNVRHDTRAVVDALHAWWCVERRRTLTQWEAFDILLGYALSNPALELPPQVRALTR